MVTIPHMFTSTVQCLYNVATDNCVVFYFMLSLQCSYLLQRCSYCRSNARQVDGSARQEDHEPGGVSLPSAG